MIWTGPDCLLSSGVMLAILIRPKCAELNYSRHLWIQCLYWLLSTVECWKQIVVSNKDVKVKTEAGYSGDMSGYRYSLNYESLFKRSLEMM
jgi:hypothetical protein